jgi:hypothetical protein
MLPEADGSCWGALKVDGKVEALQVLCILLTLILCRDLVTLLSMAGVARLKGRPITILKVNQVLPKQAVFSSTQRRRKAKDV